MKLDIILTGPLDVNTYVLRGDDAKECVVIDPADADKVNAFMAQHGLTCGAVLVTHAHFDHILGVAALQRQGARVYIGKKDAPGLYDAECSVTPRYVRQFDGCRADVTVSEGNVITEAGISFDVLETPGHTRGGVAYVQRDERMIFAGDTLFRYSIGRTDLPGGSSEQLYSSIKDKLFALEGDFIVYPGHGGASTLNAEREHNPYIKMGPLKW